ncbi:MAG: YdcF family protein [Cyanobacteria bacterium P01_G01_bin.54]
MFAILCAILLLILVLLLLWYLMARVIPEKAYLILGVAFVLAILVINFIAPASGFPAEIWQIISVPLSPFGLPLFLLFLALFKVKKDKVEPPGQMLVIIAFVLIFISSQPMVAYKLAQWVEQEAVSIEVYKEELCNGSCDEDLSNVGAIALLGQNTTEPGIPYRTQTQLTDRGDRILYADTLYDQQRSEWGRTPIIIVCAPNWPGLSGGEDKQRSEGEAISELLQRLGVTKEQIEIRRDARTLRQSAEAVVAVLKAKEIMDKPVIVVTSGLRIRRAAQTFRQLEIKVISRPADFYTFGTEAEPKRTLGIEDFLPSLRAYQITNEVFEEYFATIYYFLRGWLSHVVY